MTAWHHSSKIVSMSMQRVTVAALAMCLLWSGSCGYVEQQLAARYAAEFACPSPAVTRSPGQGFRVEGCDKVAFYYCPQQQHCQLEHSREMTEQERIAAGKRNGPRRNDAADDERLQQQLRSAASELAAARSSLDAHPDAQQALGHVEADDWRMEFISVPDNASFLLLRFSTRQELSHGPCRPTISIDNRLVRTEAVEAHEVSFLLEAPPLRNMRETQPVRGVICGAVFSLNEATRKQLASTVSEHAPPSLE
jgi:hypothetical protein